MTDQQHSRLEQLKDYNKQRLFELKISKIKRDICSETPDFDMYFRFSNAEESEKLKAFVSRIPSLTATRPDFNSIPYYKKLDFVTLEANNGKAWLAFLCGEEEFFHIFIFGQISDFVKHYYEWEYISPYLIMVYSDLRRFIFIDDEHEAVEIRLE